jgi:hypothetical protein
MVSEEDKADPEAAGNSASDRAKRARYRRLTSMLMTYGYGATLYAYLQIAIPGHRPALWITICEVLAAVAFFGFAIFIAPRGEEP